jgi:tetratricopeptide (TPR) repeat protein
MRIFFSILLFGIFNSMSAQFHNLPIPQNGKPIPWRAGSNENTVIKFDTDVMVEGQALKAGSYGFHIIPNGHSHILLFSRKDNLWGSYYLDIENDIVLKVEVQDTSCPNSEHLDFEFLNRKSNRVTIALEWADRQIPFNVSVDLNKTAVEKFRYELNGENTYRWQAWNDAAAWCYNNNTNLDEALKWVNRSINGGYGGFAQNKNLTNMATKIQLLVSLQEKEEMNKTFEETKNLTFTIDNAHSFGNTLLEIGENEKAINFLKIALKKFNNEWGLQYYSAIAHYENNNFNKAKFYLKKCKENSPPFFNQQVDNTLKEMESNSYSYQKKK